MRSSSRLERLAAPLFCSVVCACTCFSQQPTNPANSNTIANTSPSRPHYSSVFKMPSSRNPLSAYSPSSTPEPELTNSPRLNQLIRDGKLYLSLKDAIRLAMENNLDIAIARYNLPIADMDILRTKAGGVFRGVNAGVVQGTPGGGVGGFGTGAPGAGAGGTTAGAGGAGAGASGLVQSTLGVGTAVQSYDPSLNANLRVEHGTFPLSSNVLSGAVPFLQQNLGTANFNYQQAFRSGTSMTVEFDNTRGTDNTLTSTLVPQIQSGFRFSLRQRLLSGFGLGPNTRFIQIARNNREISDVSFRNQVIATVSQIQNIYWDLVNAYEDVKVKQRSLSLAEQTLSDDRQQVKIGAMAPIEVLRAESEVAARNQDLLLSQNELQLQELLIKNAITRDLSDPVVSSAPVVPTDTMRVPEQEPVTPVQDLMADALSHRPELAEARIDLHNRDISRKAAANAMLPTLDLIAFYGASGLAGMQNPNNPSLAPGVVPRSGFPNAFATLFRNDFPDYAVGFNVSIPIRNRAAQADEIRSQLEYRQ